MKKNDFYQQLAELLELEDHVVLTAETDLTKLDEFDSLAIMSIVSFADKNFSRQISGESLEKITTVDSLMEAIGRDCFE